MSVLANLTAGQWRLIVFGVISLLVGRRVHRRRRFRFRTNRRPRRASTPAIRDDFTTAQRAEILAHANGCCCWCWWTPPHQLVPVHYETDCQWIDGCPTCFEADHYYPRSKGGPTTVENGVASCRRHNRLKSDRDPDEFLAAGGR